MFFLQKRVKHLLYLACFRSLGKEKTYNGVRLGFTKGYLMRDEINYLDKGKRKQVYWRDYKSIKEIDIDLVRSYIFEAAFLDKA